MRKRPEITMTVHDSDTSSNGEETKPETKSGFFPTTLIIAIDRFGVIKRLSESALRALGWNTSELNKHTIQSLIVKAERAQFTTLLNECVETKRRCTTVVNFLEGNVCSVRYHCHLESLHCVDHDEVIVYASPEEPHRINALKDFKDKTVGDRYASLSTKLELLSKVASISITGITICDSKRKLLWANDAFEKITGYCLDEIKNRSLGVFLQGENTDKKVTKHIHDYLNNGVDVDVEILNYSKRGVEYWCHLLISPVFEQNEITHFIGIQHDITQQKKQHEVLSRRSRMHAVAQLAGKVCHDINNIMAIISGNVQLLSMQKSDEKAAQYIENIEVATDRASCVTQDLLRKVKSEQQDKRPTNINQTINDAITLMNHRFTASVVYETHLQYRNALAINKALFLEVILSLLYRSNDAIKKAGSISIETCLIDAFNPQNGVVLHRPANHERYAFVSVKDSGVGIEASKIPDYFAPREFHQMRAADTPDFTLLDDFCLLSKSGLVIHSHLDRGTTVCIWIPENGFNG